MTSPLPTREEMFQHAIDELDRAYKALGDAQDWLKDAGYKGAGYPQ